MTPKEIRKQLLDREVKQVEIARQENVDPSAISLTIDGKCVSARLRRAIAGAIGVPVEKIWPPKDRSREAA
jgi:lambda repressor-like predicted transcriptional regulator